MTVSPQPWQASEALASFRSAGNAMAKPPRRHHLVPKFYLRRFAKHERVRVRPRDFGKKAFETHVENASVRSHYYTVDLKDGTRSTAIEKMLSEVEGAAADVFRGLDNGVIPSGEAREMFSFYMTLQMTRTQSQRKTMDEMGTAVVRRLLEIAPIAMARDLFVKRTGHEPRDDELERERAQIRAQAKSAILEGTQNNHIEAMLTNARDLAPLLGERGWSVIDFGEPLLLTSDNPVLPYSPPSEIPAGWGVGIANAAFVAYPLDPQHALFMYRREFGPVPPRQSATRKEAAGMNRDVALQAEDWIFEHPDLAHVELEGLPSRGSHIG